MCQMTVQGSWWLRVTHRPGRDTHGEGGRVSHELGDLLPLIVRDMGQAIPLQFIWICNRRKHLENLNLMLLTQICLLLTVASLQDFLNFFFNLSLRTITLTEKQCLESATNVLFLPEPRNNCEILSLSPTNNCLSFISSLLQQHQLQNYHKAHNYHTSWEHQNTLK